MAGKTNNHPILPEDLWTEIFLRSSVKSLLCAKCVCKQWYVLIRDTNFVLEHLQYQKSHNKGRLLLQRFKEDTQRYKYALFDDENLVSNSYHVLDSFELSFNFIHMEGPVNGVYCLFNHYDRIILWNPALMEAKILPLPQTHLFPRDIDYDGCIGFGMDPLNHDYKLVLIRSAYGKGKNVSVQPDNQYLETP